MELYIGDKVVQLNKKKYERLDDKKTKTNITYRNGDEVIKIFKNAILEDETFYRYFVDCNLNLKLVSKPNNLVYDKKNKFAGTTSNYIDGIEEFDDYYEQLLKMFKNEFIENFYMLQDDLNILSKYGIAVDDIGMYNCVFCNKKIYHIDYGDFKRSTDSFKINNEVFDIFTENVVFHIYRKYQGYVPHWVLYSTDYLKFLEKNMSEQETVKQFIKKNSIIV